MKTGPTAPVPAALGRTVAASYDETRSRVEAALAAEGFGVLTRIDVRETMKQKLGVELPRFEILGACNPPLAHRALEAVPEVGVFLPCNVVLRELPDGRTRVEAVNARAMAAAFPGGELEPVADEVGERLRRVLDSV